MIIGVRVKEEITPLYLRCSFGGCPAVFELSDGELLIIGKTLSADFLKQVEGRIAPDETAIKLSPEFFKGLIARQRSGCIVCKSWIVVP